MKKITEIIGFLMITACMQLTSAVEDELIFAQIVYRHGNRTISGKSFPNDPNINPIFWPEGFFALTNAGKKLQFELGKYLRRRYNQLIGPGYNSKKVYIQSSDTDRALMSAQANCAGLFEPTENEKWNSSIAWQPIPIHTLFPAEDDYLITQYKPCDKLNKIEMKLIEESEEMITVLGQNSKLITYVEENTGMHLKTNREKVYTLFIIYDTLTVESERGLLLPEWAQHVLKFEKENFEYIKLFATSLPYQITELRKIRDGFLIKEIFDRFRNKTLSLSDPELSLYDVALWIYSAHDNTIISILRALNVFDMKLPPYAACLHFELRKSQDEYYVQLFYRTDNSEYIPPMEIPNCGFKCPLSKLYELYKDIIPTKDETYESLCRL